MIRRPPRSTLFPLHDALPISCTARLTFFTLAVRPIRMLLITSRVTATRSEEHTSELQSQSNLVCRLLLEKKKKHLIQRSDAGYLHLVQVINGVDRLRQDRSGS